MSPIRSRNSGERVSDEPLNLDLFAQTPELDEERGQGPSDASAVRPTPLTEPPPLWPDDESVPDSAAPGPSDAGREPPVPARRDAPPSGAPSDSWNRGRDEGEPRIWSVSQVNRGVRLLLESTFAQIWVGGEVGRWTRHASGHCYFSLKDDRAQLRCVMFQSDAARLPMDPEEGMTVRALGGLSLYESRGEYQLVVRRLESETGEGLWRLAFQRLQVKLDAEGLLDPARKRPIPRFPGAVGVVTSPSGAALRDIVTVIGRRAPWTRLIVRGARVQGEGAGVEVAAAIDALATSGLVDVIIAGRGGGSIEDLWAFNEEVVARAIVASSVPVISAVGHEVDVTIADLVADHRAATPSAAAEAAVPDGAALEGAVEAVRDRLVRGLRGSVATRARRVRDAVVHLGRAARRLLEPRRLAIRSLGTRLERALGRLMAPRRRAAADARGRLGRAMAAVLDRRRRRLVAVSDRMNALSPLATLTRGYAVPLDEEGRVLRNVERFQAGRRFVLRVVDGRVTCETLEAEPIDERGGPRER